MECEILSHTSKFGVSFPSWEYYLSVVALAFYDDIFERLNVGRVGAHEGPHKPVMLLAVLDLFAQRTIKENRVTYSPELLELFAECFVAVREEGDQPTPINPFFPSGRQAHHCEELTLAWRVAHSKDG
jgi:hypothetical protein